MTVARHVTECAAWHVRDSQRWSTTNVGYSRRATADDTHSANLSSINKTCFSARPFEDKDALLSMLHPAVGPVVLKAGNPVFRSVGRRSTCSTRRATKS